MNRWPADYRKKARGLRKKGYAYSRIMKELIVPKSTLHYWISDLKRPKQIIAWNKRRWALEIQPMGALANRRKREQLLSSMAEEAKREVSGLGLDSRARKAILSMLYWAEGSKGRDVLNFANTDPRMMLLFVTLLRNCYKLDESKIRVKLNLHWYHIEGKVKKFWSKLLDVPETQFYKTYRKRRGSNKIYRRNFSGICFFRYNSVSLKDRLMAYAIAISERTIGKIELS